jgi:hypothetical protein
VDDIREPGAIELVETTRGALELDNTADEDDCTRLVLLVLVVVGLVLLDDVTCAATDVDDVDVSKLDVLEVEVTPALLEVKATTNVLEVDTTFAVLDVGEVVVDLMAVVGTAAADAVVNELLITTEDVVALAIVEAGRAG